MNGLYRSKEAVLVEIKRCKVQKLEGLEKCDKRVECGVKGDATCCDWCETKIPLPCA